MDKTERIKYFGENDMSIWYFLEKAEPIINSFDPSKEYTDINEVIELYNVQELMNSGTVLKRWDDETVERLRKTCRQFSAIIGRFFSGITSSNLCSSYRSLNHLYLEDFWSLVEKYKVYERVDGKVLSEMLWMAIANGNRAVGKAFEPNREQYIMLCDMVNRVYADIERMQKDYGLE